MEHLEQLNPVFRPLIRSVLIHVSHMTELAGCSWYIASSFRDPTKQWELFKKGRKLVGVDWVKKLGHKVVTNATPDDSAHCVTLRDGSPASCAIDIALTEGRSWLSNKDPRWGIIGAAASIVDHSRLVWGGMWDSLRDWPHLELKDWREM